MPRMRTNREFFPVHLVRFETPKGVALQGYWIGALRPRRVIVWVHGLGSTMFSKREIADLLAKDLTAVLMFNNRGHDKVASVPKGRGYLRGGAGREVFTECVDDLSGAVAFAKRSGAREVFLAGHSTGCQKSVYFASKRPHTVAGIILLAPISDFAAKFDKKRAAKKPRARNAALALVKKGRGASLLSEDIWDEILEARRFLSLYTHDSVEQSIFTYFDPARRPRILRSVQEPIFVLLAEKDEFADRSAKKIQDWFGEHVKIGDRVQIIPNVRHSFKGGEREVAGSIKKWLSRSVS